LAETHTSSELLDLQTSANTHKQTDRQTDRQMAE